MGGISFNKTSQTTTVYTTKTVKTTVNNSEQESLNIGTLEDTNNISKSQKGLVPSGGVKLTDAPSSGAGIDLIKNILIKPAGGAIVPGAIAYFMDRDWKKGMAMGALSGLGEGIAHSKPFENETANFIKSAVGNTLSGAGLGGGLAGLFFGGKKMVIGMAVGAVFGLGSTAITD
jgi:hypothetical protein